MTIDKPKDEIDLDGDRDDELFPQISRTELLASLVEEGLLEVIECDETGKPVAWRMLEKLRANTTRTKQQ
jgi:hypothetical protein